MKEMKYQAVKEEIIYFDLPNSDGLRIKGILRGKFVAPLAIMMHGRPSSSNALLQYLGARYLYEQGISTLRLSMYGFEAKTRNLMDCNLETHVEDFEAVVGEVRKQTVGPILAIGHSYGGLTILKSKAKLDGVVLWDPSHGLWWDENRDALFTDEFPETTIDEFIIGTAGKGWVYPAKAKKYDEQLGDTSKLAAKDYPLKIISAGKGALTDLGERYFKAANEPKSHVIVKDAGHGFEESDNVMLELFEETASWLSKIVST
jgi:pimeloyl-ACP methyl ester carboxylesterase